MGWAWKRGSILWARLGNMGALYGLGLVTQELSMGWAWKRGSSQLAGLGNVGAINGLGWEIRRGGGEAEFKALGIVRDLTSRSEDAFKHL